MRVGTFLTMALILAACAPAGFAQDEETGENGVLKASEIEKRLDPGAAAAPKTRGLTRGLVPRGVTVEAPPSVTFHLNFKHDSTELADARSRLQLEEAAKALAGEKLKPFRFRVEGHTDTTGSAEYNQELSERRARAIVETLIGQFAIEATRLRAEGRGESEPAVAGEDEEAHAANRRVVIELME